MFYGHNSEGPTLDSLDADGAVIHNALPCPYPAGRSADPLNNGTGSLSVAPDESQAWLIFGLCDASWSTWTGGQCHWDGSSWSFQQDTQPSDWEGESVAALNGGVLALRTGRPDGPYGTPTHLWVSTIHTQ